MHYFLSTLHARNEILSLFGWVCLAASLLFIVLSQITHTQIRGANAWAKPFKFAFSTALYSWAMAWFCAYLPPFNIALFNWVVVILLGFEIVYIAGQAGRGQLSHFNVSSPLYSALYAAMAMAASIVAAYTGYIGILFCSYDLPELPDYYVWSIRIAIFIFVIFSFEGFVMGSRMSHTIGGADGGEGLPVLNWSTRYGDPRIAHFIGMHALQVIPLLSFYCLRNTPFTVILGVAYFALAVFTLVQALRGKPFHQV